MFDRLKNQLLIGDIVALAYRNKLVIGRIEKFHLKMITVQGIQTQLSYLRHPGDVIKLEGFRLTAWLLTV